MGKLNGQVALVTGGASGIGRATAEVLAAHGAKVMATDVDRDGLAQFCNSIDASGAAIKTAHQDVTDEARWSEVFSETNDALGPVSILVNNAGIAVAGSILDFSLDDWQQQMSVNLDSVFLGTREGVKAMKDTGGGSIINLSSVAGLRGAAGASAYCASKGGVRLFSKAIAIECAQMGYGIRVNSVHPGIIDTPIWTKSIARMTEVTSDPEQIAALTAETGANALDPEAIAQGVAPMVRAGKPEEIGEMIAFLASNEASYITGQEFVVDGGMTAR